MKKGILKEFAIIGGIIVLVGGTVFALTHESELKEPKKNNNIAVSSDEKNQDNNKNISQDKKSPENNLSVNGSEEKLEDNEDSNESEGNTEKNEENVQVMNFDLTNSSENIFEGTVDVSLVQVEYDNNILTITGQVDNKSGEVINGHVSNFYFKDAEEVITNLDFFDNPSFNINAPSGGKTNFQMVFKNIKLQGNKFTIGGEFFKFGYFGPDKSISLEVTF